MGDQPEARCLSSPNNTTQKTRMYTRDSSGFRTDDPSVRDPLLRPRGHYGRLILFLSKRILICVKFGVLNEHYYFK